jgi:hypothetical protein
VISHAIGSRLRMSVQQSSGFLAKWQYRVHGLGNPGIDDGIMQAWSPHDRWLLQPDWNITARL